MSDKQPVSYEELKRILECLLFVAAEPVTCKQMAEITGYANSAIKIAVSELKDEYSGKGFELKQIAGGWQFMTKPEYSGYIEKLYRPKFQQLSAAAMETLAIIAYKQPITKAEISDIRQVAADSVVANLLDKKLIKEVGRVDIPGRPILYGTTDDFLRFFGINSIQDLPALPENGSEQQGSDQSVTESIINK